MNRASLQYQDNWAAGWHLANCKYSLDAVQKTEAEGNQIGMVDGWKARAEAVRLVENSEAKK